MPAVPDPTELAHRRAAAILDEAWRQAEQLQAEALAELQAEIDRRLADAEAAGTRIRRSAERTAARLRADAEAEIERRRRELAAEAEAFWNRARDEAETVLAEARQAADRLLADARETADRLLTDARAAARTAAERGAVHPGAAPPAARDELPDTIDITTPGGGAGPPLALPQPAAAPPAGPRAQLEIVVLCTANMRRSPLAAAMLERRLAAAGVSARVRSAGMLGAGQGASPEAEAVAAERGLDLSGHRSRKVDADLLRGADLVIGMAREHVREVVVLADDVFPRSFTLRELVRRAEERGPREPHEAFADWLHRLHEGRVVEDLLEDVAEDDVADPGEGSLRRHERTAEEIDGLVARFVEAAWGVPTHPRPGQDILPWAGEESEEGGRPGLLRRLLRR